MSQPIIDVTGKGTSSGTTFSWTHTVGGGLLNSIILASVGGDIAGSISSMTYAGTAMTKIAGTVAAGGPSDCEIWYLLKPPSGLGTFHGTIAGATSQETDAFSVSYQNVNQITPILGSVIAAGTATSGSITRALTGGGNSIFFGATSIDNTAGTTATGSQLGTESAGNGNLLVADLNTGTINWTYAGNTVNFANIGVELYGIAARTGYISLLGVGQI